MVFICWAFIAILLAFGFLGCFINKFPGPACVFIALLIAKLGLDINFSWGTVVVVGLLAVASYVIAGYVVKVAKKLQEFSKLAGWGTTLGSIVGLVILCEIAPDSAVAEIILIIVLLTVIPFAFAFGAEMINKKPAPEALKGATSATVAYLANTFLKLVVFVYAIYYIFDLG